MDSVDIAVIAIASLVFFVLGVLFHKYAVSEANSIKAHVTDELSALRADIVGGAQKELNKVSSKL